MPSGRGLKDSGLRRARPTEANFSVIPCTTLLPWLLWYSSAVTILGREGGAVQVHSPSAGGRCLIPERMARPQNRASRAEVQIGPRELHAAGILSGTLRAPGQTHRSCPAHSSCDRLWRRLWNP